MAILAAQHKPSGGEKMYYIKVIPSDNSTWCPFASMLRSPNKRVIFIKNGEENDKTESANLLQFEWYQLYVEMGMVKIFE